MTIEVAAYAVGVILICCIIWQTHRNNGRRLSEIQRELSGLREIMSRVFLMKLTEKSDGAIAAPTKTTSEVHSEPAKEDTSSAPEPAIETDLVQVDALCAKLITLAPPKEAQPLILQPGPSGFAARRL